MVMSAATDAAGMIPRLSAFYFFYCVRGWLATKDIRSGRLYFRDAWLCRKETHGNNAPVTLVIKGTELQQALNHDGGPLKEDFDKMCEDLGYCYELGYCWSVHFYPKT